MWTDDRNCGLGHGRECLSRQKKANSRRCNRWPWEPLIMLFDEVFPALAWVHVYGVIKKQPDYDVINRLTSCEICFS